MIAKDKQRCRGGSEVVRGFGDGEQLRARVVDGVEERLRERVRVSSSELGQRQSARRQLPTATVT
jgi:hypothetical protein